MKNTKKYELIIVIVNEGFTDAIVESTRKAGASGGTVLSARTAVKEKAVKSYGLAIAGDKEVIMILTEDKTKNAIMDAIYKVSGIETKGMAIIFTVPADHVAGLRKPRPQKQNKK